MKTFSLPIPSLRFGEFDLGGVLYHANYFHIYEQVREAFLSEGPIPYAQLVRLGCHLAVVESEQKFLKPLRYGEEFTAQLWVEELKRASFRFRYALFTNHEIHRASTSMVFVETRDQQLAPAPLPASLASYLKEYLKVPL